MKDIYAGYVATVTALTSLANAQMERPYITAPASVTSVVYVLVDSR